MTPGEGVRHGVSAKRQNKASCESQLVVTPLGAGMEVGRSCILAQYRRSSVIFDCGVHPALEGFASLPVFGAMPKAAEGAINDNSTSVVPSSSGSLHYFPGLENVDVVLITHFHLDHCGAVPYLIARTNFKGRVYMTSQTKAIAYLLWQDYLRVTTGAGRQQVSSHNTMLYDRSHVERAMTEIRVVDFHATTIDQKSGIAIRPLIAGHVVGACQFEVDMEGAKVLYTGDFSFERDRSIRFAEMPYQIPDVVISESTFGTRVHTDRATREASFLNSITNTVLNKRGRVLLPVFALGRAQELLLMLEDYWSKNAELLADIPVYYISPLAVRAMPVFRASANQAGAEVRNLSRRGINAYQFKHIRVTEAFSRVKQELLSGKEPCVVISSPGMLQSGPSRALFEAWAPHAANTIILTGYSVKGTLADALKAQPRTVPMGDQTVVLRASVVQICFSAHADFAQIKRFLLESKSSNLILVHGERTEAVRIQRELQRSYPRFRDHIWCPEIGQRVFIYVPNCQQINAVGDAAEELINRRAAVLLKNENLVKVNKSDELTRWAAESDRPEVLSPRICKLAKNGSLNLENFDIKGREEEEVLKQSFYLDVDDVRRLAPQKNIKTEGETSNAVVVASHLKEFMAIMISESMTDRNTDRDKLSFLGGDVSVAVRDEETGVRVDVVTVIANRDNLITETYHQLIGGIKETITVVVQGLVTDMGGDIS